jgi:hypothetical protein
LLERGDIVEKKKLTSVYIGAENFKWLKALADVEGRSFSNTLDRLIQEVRNARGD